MASNRGKQFEAKLKEDGNRTFPDSFLFRIPDQVSGYLTTSQNPCDFLGYTEGKLFLIECKSIEGNTINYNLMRQYERLLQYKNKTGVFPGILIGFRDHDKVIGVPVQEAERIKNLGNKSINIKMVNNPDYNIIEIPSTKKRVFMDSDYSVLLKLGDNNERSK